MTVHSHLISLHMALNVALYSILYTALHTLIGAAPLFISLNTSALYATPPPPPPKSSTPIASTSMIKTGSPLKAHPKFGALPFDGPRAFADLKRYVERGHRYYGAPERAQVIQSLINDLSRAGASVTTQTFEVVESRSKLKYSLTNIIGRVHPERPIRILLGSHWDTRLWAEEDADPTQRERPIQGANDGTSGIAVLLELARQLTADPLQEIGIDLVFFDGEEFGRPQSDDYCKGSRHFADRLSLYYQTPPIAVIIIDMVGERGLNLPIERSSWRHARPLVRHIWAEAKLLNASAFSTFKFGPWIIDDHTPFQKRGIPSILLIDYQYPQWHTHQDTLDRCDAESLAQVGRVLEASLRRFDLQHQRPSP
jgi:glutaminyl-peptide cyclotransferase